MMPVKITALTHDGRGIAQVEGKTVFIQGALPGEEVLFTFTSRHGKYDEGKVSEIITPSPQRTEPLCQHFNICGGCALQHMSSAMQIQTKQQLLLDQLQHFGGVQPQTVLPPITGPVWGYRQKARLSVKFVGKKQIVLVGFHEKKGRYVADIVRCEILRPPLDSLITPLKTLILQLKAYQHIPQIEVAITDSATALVFRHLEPLGQNDIEQLIEFAKLYQLHIYLQPKGPESVHLLWPKLADPHLLSYRLDAYNLELDFNPTGFIQINAAINQQMIARALELLAIRSHDKILDLFCGIGNFTLPLARYAQEVIGVEGDAQLVNLARANAAKNQLSNVQFHQADLNNELQFLSKQNFNKILLDPPRVGALAAIQQLSPFNAERIVYISCNPATLARDAKELVMQGYQLQAAGVMDMFPHTHHVEAIALFARVLSHSS